MLRLRRSSGFRGWLFFLRVALLLLVGVSAVQAGDCQLAAGDHLGRTLSVGGSLRSYDVFVPAGCDPAAPFSLVLDFHGGFSNRAAHKNLSGVRAAAVSRGFVVVQPEGTGVIPGIGFWNIGFDLLGPLAPPGFDYPQDYPDDVAFARALVGEISKRLPIRRDRVFATGHSMGGGLVHLLGCRAADLFRAIAPVSFWLEAPQVLECAPARPIAVRTYHGYVDRVICYEQTLPLPAIGLVFQCPVANTRTAPESFFRWAALAGCAGSFSEDLRGAFGSALFEFAECPAGPIGLFGIGTNYFPEIPVEFGDPGHNPYANLDGIDVAADALDFFLALPEPRAIDLGFFALAALAFERRRRTR